MMRAVAATFCALAACAGVTSAAAATPATSAKPAAAPACTLTVSLKTVKSEDEPMGNIPAILVKGAAAKSTPGGTATALERCVYYYGPDVTKGSSKPLYTGNAWPYVYVPSGCKIAIDSTVPANAAIRKAGYVKAAADGLLLIGGLPVYQYPSDSDLTCICNFPPDWSSIYANGDGAAFPVKHPTGY